MDPPPATPDCIQFSSQYDGKSKTQNSRGIGTSGFRIRYPAIWGGLTYLFAFRQIERHLEKGVEWLAGGQGPTSADYMTGFALEAWNYGEPNALGPKTKAYVNRIHAR